MRRTQRITTGFKSGMMCEDPQTSTVNVPKSLECVIKCFDWLILRYLSYFFERIFLTLCINLAKPCVWLGRLFVLQYERSPRFTETSWEVPEAPATLSSDRTHQQFCPVLCVEWPSFIIIITSPTWPPNTHTSIDSIYERKCKQKQEWKNSPLRHWSHDSAHPFCSA